MTYNEKIVKLRKANGMSQDVFAKAVGVSRQAVYKWEAGQSYPEAGKLLEIKKLFGISIDDLLDDSYEVVIEKKEPKKKRASAAKAEEAAKEEAPVAEQAPITASAEEVTAEEKKEEVHKAAAPKAVPSAAAAKKQNNNGLMGIMSGLFGRRKK